MELHVLLSLLIVADILFLRLIARRGHVVRFVSMSILFALETVLIVALVSSPFHPVFRLQDLPRAFWIQLLICCWWVLLARELVTFLQLLGELKKSPIQNKLLSNIIADQHLYMRRRGDAGNRFSIPDTGRYGHLRDHRDRAWIGPAKHSVGCLFRYIAQH
jgi:hypothetical protein